MAELELRAKLQGVVAGLQQTLGRATNLVAYGLHAANSTSDLPIAIHGGFTLPGVMMGMAFSPVTSTNVSEFRDEFQRWVLECGFRDCTEALGPLLEQVRLVGTAVAVGPKISADDWNSRVIGERSKFDKMHMPDKTKFLENLCGPSILPPLITKVNSINYARNCIAHRRGVVGDRDANSPDGLLVEWIKMDFFVKYSDSEEIMTTLPFVVNEGGTVSVRQSESSKLFRRGDRIWFSAQEFSELCWTLFVFGQQLAENLRKLMADKGLVDIPQPVDSPPAVSSDGEEKAE